MLKRTLNTALKHCNNMSSQKTLLQNKVRELETKLSQQEEERDLVLHLDAMESTAVENSQSEEKSDVNAVE